jgi:FtsP/CotA-like multicopper oxidase with cupredoxin domain
MSEKTIVTDQAGEGNSNESARVKQKSETSRRNFLQLAIAAGSGLAIYSMVPALVKESWFAQQPNCNPAAGGQPLQSIMEIKTGPNNILKGVLKLLDEKKVYLGQPNSGSSSLSCNSGQMRYLSGYDANLPPLGRKTWPFVHGVPAPGPTLRAKVGDMLQITLLNHVDVRNFPNTLDVAEHGQACDQNTTFGVGNTYPGTVPSQANPTPSTPFFENPPNCIHGSSSVNLHFHGTHTSPSGISDNVLLNVRPSPRGRDGQPVVNEANVKPIFDQIFAACVHGHMPMEWNQWPAAWQTWQQKLLVQYDNTTPWMGNSPTAGNPALPLTERLWYQNKQEMLEHELPQYYIGAFPNCVNLPKWNGQRNSMGQAPGTHWYHAHKHGSTAMNLANGMAGALIIEGDYDATLKSYYQSQGQPIKEQVLVMQSYAAVLGPLRAEDTGDLVSVNGNYQPVLEMKPNETQFWRIVNACHARGVPLDKNPPNGLKWVQTAQDGVQLDPRNYNPDPNAPTNAFPVPAQALFINGKWLSTGSLAAGNRIDLLVKAPSTSGTYPVTFAGGTLLLTVRVTGTALNAVPFPSQAQFPQMPGFLADIRPPAGMVKREIRFNTTKTQFASPSPTPTPQESDGSRNPFNAPPPLMSNAMPMQTINGIQFSGEVDQFMKLGATEEWALFNDSPSNGAAHPFHIHVNPFQIVQWFDPAIMSPSLQASGVPMAEPWVWWDNFALPPGGWVKMWTRFVDYTGKYVFHCHIVEHEDRGMMQLVEVKPAVTSMKHK